ncbi:hypothetical protein MPDQ_004675 [Monascus purpureus]|uniref:O-methyltransferase n=1 Tax=Monascus purpureus TaxID=5098 RepID=A0A507QZU6_MONPU|nr:hypothetical protein MPDQ_004675 [Monascus purpureus]
MSLGNVEYATKVESYAETHLIPTEPGLVHAHENTVESEIALTPTQGKFFSLLGTMSSARNVLEIGTLGGYSSIWFSKAVRERKGKVTTIEIDSDRHKNAIKNLQLAGVKVPDEVEVLLGAALDILPKVEAEIERGDRERFDFVFIDADWMNKWKYFDYGVNLSKGKGSVICVDNTVQALFYTGTMGADLRQKGIVPLIEKVGEDGRVDAVLMQTVGKKGHDGFLMAVVK